MGIAEAPEWLLKALRERSEPQSGRPCTSSHTRPADLDEGPIPSGRRNDTLFRMGASLRARGQDQPAIEETLEKVNAERCTPPLDITEVRKIAASASRYPQGGASLSPTSEVLEALDGLETRMWQRRWRGKAGLSDRAVYVALLKKARKYGRMIPAGVRVSISVRDLALAAGVSKATASKAVNRLMIDGLIRRDGKGSGTECGAFVLLAVRDELGHSSIELVTFPNVPVGRGPRLRWQGLGKTPEAILDALDAYGPSTLQVLASYLGKDRPRDLRPHLNYLNEAGVIECDGDMYRLADDYRRALDEERQLRGEVGAERRDQARYDRERRAYRAELERRKLREHPDRAAKQVRMGAHKQRLREADGTIGELVPVGSADGVRNESSEVSNDMAPVERSSVA